MASTAADVLIDSIHDWGVDTVFGIPGDGINGIMEALRERQDKIRFIQVRHEESAAFMACAWAKYTGRIGCCLATSGPGGIHLLNGLYDVELDKLFMDVCVYNERVMGPGHVENVAEMACRTAMSYRGVAHLTIPVDIQDMTSQKRSQRNVQHHTSDAPARSARLPADEDLRRAAGILNE